MWRASSSSLLRNKPLWEILIPLRVDTVGHSHLAISVKNLGDTDANVDAINCRVMLQDQTLWLFPFPLPHVVVHVFGCLSPLVDHPVKRIAIPKDTNKAKLA